MNYKIGKRYKAIGNCGMAKGVEVTGTLADHDVVDIFIINDERLKMPCSVYEYSLEEIKE